MELLAIVLTYNEAAHLGACIESVRFADAVMVFDSFSTDATTTIAQAAGVIVRQRLFDDYAGQRNAALDAARELGARWVLFIDADERVMPALADEVRRAIAAGTAAGYRIPRHNYLFGRLTRGAGWYPDYQTRLLNVDRARYDSARQVHEVVILDGTEGTLIEPLIHHNYRDVAHFREKQRRYSAYDARILVEQGVKPKAHSLVVQPLRHFAWRFVTLGGWRDGWHGLRLSALMAYYEWRKLQQAVDLWKTLPIEKELAAEDEIRPRQ